MKRSLTRIVPLLCLMLTMAGCAPFQQYRTKYDLCANPTGGFSAACAPNALQQFPAANGDAPYLLGFIEFDDQGQLWDRKQMKYVMNQLAAAAAKQDLLMVVFVHGWNHNAAPNDLMLDKFRDILAQVNENELVLSRGAPARKVAGVYLGWRGESMTPPFSYTTFWDRKNVSGKVGSTGVQEVLSNLEQLKRDKNNITHDNGTRLAVIGHSFGAEVVYSALSQVLTNRFVITPGPAGQQGNVGGFGDLVVLINPAFESERYAPLSDMSTERGNYFRSQLPVMAVMTSDADTATGNAFPLGRWFSTVFEKERDTQRYNAVTRQYETIDEKQTNRIALGHYAPYQTHSLYPAGDSRGAKLSAEDSVLAAQSFASAWEDDAPGSKIAVAGLTLERSTASAGRNPYLVIKAANSLITEHNDIDDPRIIEFVKQLILVSTRTEEQRTLMLKKEARP